MFLGFIRATNFGLYFDHHSGPLHFKLFKTCNAPIMFACYCMGSHSRTEHLTERSQHLPANRKSLNEHYHIHSDTVQSLLHVTDTVRSIYGPIQGTHSTLWHWKFRNKTVYVNIYDTYRGIVHAKLQLQYCIGRLSNIYGTYLGIVHAKLQL